MSDGMATLVGLFGAISAGPSNAGSREDGKICTAQPGECRFNHRYYTPGMRDATSWSMPSADESCPERCPYLQEDPRDMGTEDERRARASQLVEGLKDKRDADRATAKLVLAMLDRE